jgi:hypothetical protein
MWGFSRALAIALAGMVPAAQGAAAGVLYSGEGYSVSVTPVVEGGLNKFQARLLLDNNLKPCGGAACGYIAVGFIAGAGNGNMAGSKMIACYTGAEKDKQLCATSTARPPACQKQSDVGLDYGFAGEQLNCTVTASSVGGTDFTVGTVSVIYAIGKGDASSTMQVHNFRGSGQTFTNSAPSVPSNPPVPSVTSTPTTATPTTATPTTAKPSHASGLSTAVVLGLVISLLGLVR